MIDSLSIQNFKNLSGLTIPALSRVNLISGKNNVGKSSLLEALSLYISDSQLMSVLAGRGENLRSSFKDSTDTILRRNYEALSSLFRNRDNRVSEDNVITISDGNNFVSIHFVNYIIETYELDGSIFRRETVIDDPRRYPNEETYLALEIIRSDDTIVRLPLNKSLDRIKMLIDANRHNFDNLITVNSNYDNADFISKLWDSITLTEKEDYVIEALRIIEPGIVSLAFLEDSFSNVRRERYPVVKVDGMKGRIPLRSMGDGINHILAIILALVNCENGCALVDEIDNGLHYTVQKQLWEIIFKLAKQLNVQVFATTHSSDCISSFSKILSQADNAREGRYIRLELKKGNVSQTEYSSGELEIVAAENIEIR